MRVNKTKELLKKQIKEIIGVNKFQKINTFPTSEFYITWIFFFGMLCLTIFALKNNRIFNSDIIFFIVFFFGSLYYIYILYFDTAHEIFITETGVIIKYATKVIFYPFKECSIDHDVVSSFRNPPCFYLIFLSNGEKKHIQIYAKYKTFRWILSLIRKYNK